MGARTASYQGQSIPLMLDSQRSARSSGLGKVCFRVISPYGAQNSIDVRSMLPLPGIFLAT